MAPRRSLSVRKHDTINAPDRQYALLTGSRPFSKEYTKVVRVGHSQGHLGRRRSPRLPAVVVSPLLWPCLSNGDPWFWRWWGDGDHELMWGCVLSCIWSAFWCVELVRVRQNGGEISHFRRAETMSFHRPIKQMCPKKWKQSKTIPRLKLRKVRKICYVPNSWYKPI